MGGMQLRGLLTEDRAVSPVIGVILMVAITVILASIVGVFAFDVFGENSQEAPGIIFQYDYAGSSGGSPAPLTVRHQSGDVVQGAALKFKEQNGGGTTISPTDWGAASEVRAGSTVTINNVDPGATVLIVWNQQQQGEDTAVIGTCEGPDA